jgi:excisionase family DNA binding protein
MLDTAISNPPSFNGSPWLDAQEAAKYLSVSPRTLLKWARTGHVRGYQLSGTERHVWRFRREDLDGMLEAPSVALPRRIQ